MIGGNQFGKAHLIQVCRFQVVIRSEHRLCSPFSCCANLTAPLPLCQLFKRSPRALCSGGAPRRYSPSVVGADVKAQGTCRNLLKREAALWTFVWEAGVEPRNNCAERPLRRAVLWRRRSFGTQSPAGSQFVERILTTVTTLRQQRRDVLRLLDDRLHGSDSPRSCAFPLTADFPTSRCSLVFVPRCAVTQWQLRLTSNVLAAFAVLKLASLRFVEYQWE